MAQISGSNKREHLAAYLILAAGVVFLIILLSTVKQGVFFSGDAGVKYLMVDQIASGGSWQVITPAKPEWVKRIWAEGFFPLKEPFVYQVAKGRVVAFPSAFQWITVPFYKAWGYAGLYVIPVAAILFLWLFFWRTMNRLVQEPKLKIALLIALIFCSPLTIYGAIYWEHSLAALCLFLGIAFIARRPASVWTCFLLGLICGGAAWLRPEAIIFSGLLAISTLFARTHRFNMRHYSFLAGLAVATLSFVSFNYSVYAHPLGVHAFQLMPKFANAVQRPSDLNILTHINLRLIQYFPFTVYMALILYPIIRRTALPVAAWQLTVIITCFLLITPFFLPNAGGKQWGPRYLLPVIPSLLFLFAILFNHIAISNKVRRALTISFVCLAGWGLYVNVVSAYQTLRDDYATRVYPALHRVKSDPSESVIVQNQYITQELATLFKEKNFFLAEDAAAMDRLIDKLQHEGIRKIIYISSSANDGLMSEKLRRQHILPQQTGSYFITSVPIPAEN